MEVLQITPQLAPQTAISSPREATPLSRSPRRRRRPAARCTGRLLQSTSSSDPARPRSPQFLGRPCAREFPLAPYLRSQQGGGCRGCRRGGGCHGAPDLASWPPGKEEVRPREVAAADHHSAGELAYGHLRRLPSPSPPWSRWRRRRRSRPSEKRHPRRRARHGRHRDELELQRPSRVLLLTSARSSPQPRRARRGGAARCAGTGSRRREEESPASRRKREWRSAGAQRSTNGICAIRWCAEIHQRHPSSQSLFASVTFDWLILRHLPQLSSCAIERSRGAGHGLKLPTREMVGGAARIDGER